MPAPIRILAIGHEASRSGAAIIHLGWLKWATQQPNRFELRSITVRPGPLLKEWPKETSNNVLSWIHPQKDIITRWFHTRLVDRPGLLRRRLERALCRLGPAWADVVLVNTLTLGWLFEPLKSLAVPVVVHAHELGESIRQFTYPADIERMKRIAYRWIAVSNSVGTYLEESLGVDPRLIDVVRNFVPPRPTLTIMPFKIEIAAAYGLPAEVPWVIAVGNVAPIKRPDLFIEVAECFRRSGNAECAFIWIGEQSATVYNRELRHANANGAVHFVGAVPDPRPWIKAATLLLITSLEESSSIVALEAAELGTPIIAIEGAGGTDEFLASGSGFLVPTASAETIAGEVGRLLRQPGIAAAAVAMAAKKVAAESNYGLQCEALASVLEGTRTDRVYQ